MNQKGEKAVFYSLRHGHGTALGDAGVPEKDIAASMHHASRTTTARYLHSDQKQVSAAIAALPDLSYPVPALATGTDGRPVVSGGQVACPSACPTGNSPVESGGVGGANVANRQSVGNVEMSAVSGDSALNGKIGLLAELADAVDSKSTARKGVSVRLR